MARLTKRVKAVREKIGDTAEPRQLDEALQAIKSAGSCKFDESVEICVNLGIDPRKSEQTVRGSTVLPHGTGRSVRVAVFADGPDADTAREAGADLVGLDELAEQVKKGNIEFDVAIATPQSMRVVGQLGQVLGPRGLMPNPKVGTVTADVRAAVSNAKAGQVQYRADKGGIVHCPVGKLSFEVDALRENIETVLADLKKAKPASAKGAYVKKVTVSSTMGPGIQVDKGSLNVI